MAIFDDVVVSWKNTEYTISGDDNIMELLAGIEDHLTLIELENGRSTGRLPMAKLSHAYAVVLRRAGCPVSAAEVYDGMWSDGQTVAKVSEAVAGLLQMMVPKSAVRRQEKQESQAKPVKKTNARSSSKPRTKRQS